MSSSFFPLSLFGFLAVLFLGRPALGQSYAFSTLAGSPGNRDYVDGIGTAARFYAPIGVTMDSSGTLFVTDGFDSYGGDGESPGSAIRRITPDGVVTTVAGSFTSVGLVDGAGSAARFRGLSGLAVDANGTLFVADTINSSVRKITPDGVVTTHARGLFFPYGVAVDPTGNVFVTTGQTIQKITPEGVITPFAGTINGFGSADGTGAAAQFTSPSGLAVDTNGDLAGLAGFGGSADGMARDARFRFPDGVAVDGNGNVFVTDSNGVRKITTNGVVTTVSRSVSGARGILDFSINIAVDGSGNLYTTESNRTIRKGVPFLGVLPAIATQPQSQTVGRGRLAVFNATALGSPAPSYHWLNDGTAISGATDATLLLTNVTAGSAGSYQCIVTNAGGSATSQSVTLTIVDTIDTGHLSNFSVRASVVAGRSIIAGFVVEGPRQKNILIRGIGPALAQFGVGGVLADPALAVISSTSQRVAENDNWPASLASVFASMGSFALPAASKDAAVLLPLQPGSYTVVLSGADGGGGEGLIEIYEVP